MAFKEKVGAYYQLTKPGIIYGNLITAAAGFLLAANGHINWALFAYTLGGTALVIGSACAFNNYIDRDIDKRMARTKERALVSGLISPQRALFFASILGIVGFLILAIHVNVLVTIIAAVAFFFYVVIYAVAKRRSIHGALIGTIPGAAPPVIGYCAVTNHLDGGALILFLILVFWQMPHFYAISLYRFKDYKEAGIPVMPTKVGFKNTKRQMIVYIIDFIFAVAALYVFGYAGGAYFIIVGAAGLYWLWAGLKDFNSGDDKLWGKKMFFISLIVNLVFAITISFNWLLVKL